MGKKYNTLRVKGFIYNPYKTMRQVIQGVWPRFTKYFYRPWNYNEIKSTRLVIIGIHEINPEQVASELK